MTEQEWLSAMDVADLFESEPLWGRGKVSERKYRLFAVACCRRIWRLMPDDFSRRAIETLEKYADGFATESELELVASQFESGEEESQRLPENQRWSRAAAFVCASQNSYRLAGEAADHCSTAVGDLSDPNRPLPNRAESQRQCDIIRDLFQPFRPVTIDPSWQTSTVVTLAHGIYDEKAFDRLPILADALQDAGCENEDVLNHCRQPGEHCRGCWVVDLLTGRK